MSSSSTFTTNTSRKKNGNGNGNDSDVILYIVFSLLLLLLLLIILVNIVSESWLEKIPWLKVFRWGKAHAKKCCHYQVEHDGAIVDELHSCSDLNCECPQLQKSVNGYKLNNMGSNPVESCSSCGSVNRDDHRK